LKLFLKLLGVYSDILFELKIFLNIRNGNKLMKTKLLFWSAILFLALGLNDRDGTLFYFFSIHSTMLLIGMFVYKHAYKPKSGNAAEPLPIAGSAKK
jgi:hypothetical protein